MAYCIITGGLVIFSAFLLSIAFIMPQLCAELVLICFIPLFIAVIKNKGNLSFVYGLLWGIVFFSIFFLCLLKLFLSQITIFLSFFAYFILVFYGALLSAGWFFFSSSLVNIGRFSNTIMILFLWLIGSSFYFFIIDMFFFVPFGSFAGNVFCHPLVPLAIRPFWLWPLGFIAKPLFTFILLLFPTALSVGFTTKHVQWFRGAFCFILLFLLGGFFLNSQRGERAPTILANIGYIAPCTETLCCRDTMDFILEKLITLYQLHPDLKLIVMPESMCKFALNNYSQRMSSWHENLKSDDLFIILGAHRKEQEKNSIFNSLYLLQKGRIIKTYDKINLVPFTEFIPSFWTFLGNSFLLLKNKDVFNKGTSIRKNIIIDKVGTFIPYICSELFFNTTLLRTHNLIKNNKDIINNYTKDIPNYSSNLYLLCIANDSWFCTYGKKLMELVVQLKAIEWNHSIIYINHTQGIILTNNGNHYTLLSN